MFLSFGAVKELFDTSSFRKKGLLFFLYLWISSSTRKSVFFSYSLTEIGSVQISSPVSFSPRQYKLVL